MTINLKNKITGVISDTHFPGNLDYALEFCQDTFSDYKVQQVVHIGDVFDHHFMSRHPSELDAHNPIEEFIRAKDEVQTWVTAFPNMTLIKGNHDRIPERQAHTLGIPSLFLKSLNVVYELPDTWRWDWDARVFKDVIISHGLGSNGMYGAKNTAQKLGCSYVQGHTHANAAVFDLPRPTGDRAAMNVGCLIDVNKYNARYGKLIYPTPMSIGCGIIADIDELYFIKMKG